MLLVFIFNGDVTLLDLVPQHWLLLVLQQLIGGVSVGVDQLQALDLNPDGYGVGQGSLYCCELF